MNIGCEVVNFVVEFSFSKAIKFVACWLVGYLILLLITPVHVSEQKLQNEIQCEIQAVSLHMVIIRQRNINSFSRENNYESFLIIWCMLFLYTNCNARLD